MKIFRSLICCKTGFLLYFFLGQGLLFGQVPKLSWGAYLPKGSLAQIGVYVDTLKSNGFVRTVLHQEYFEFYNSKPEELKQILKKGKIKESALVGGEIGLGLNEKDLTHFEEMGKFLKSIGGKYLILTSRKRDAYPPGNDELEKLASNLNLVGEKLKKLGIRLVFQNQIHRVCQSSDEFQVILNKTSKKFVGTLLDISQLVQAGGEPISFVRINKNRIDILVFQGLISPKPGFQGPKTNNYLLVDLGDGGKIDFREMFTQLKTIGVRVPAFIKSAEGMDIDSFGTSIVKQKKYLRTLGYSFK